MMTARLAGFTRPPIRDRRRDHRLLFRTLRTRGGRGSGVPGEGELRVGGPAVVAQPEDVLHGVNELQVGSTSRGQPDLLAEQRDDATRLVPNPAKATARKELAAARATVAEAKAATFSTALAGRDASTKVIIEA